MTDDEAELAEDPTTEWNRLLEDAATVAAAYRDDGSEAVVLEPNDVSVVSTDEGVGIVALVDDVAFERVRELAEGHDFADEVHRVVTDELVFLIAAFERADGEAAVVAPLYYERTPGEEGTLREHEGAVYTRVRNLAGVDVLSFAHADPAALLPDERFDEG